MSGRAGGGSRRAGAGGSAAADEAHRGGGLRRLATPRPATVAAGPDGVPARVARARVEAVTEEWIVEDRWWTGSPLRRRYFELVLADGRNVVAFCDLRSGRWFEQRV